MTGQKTSTDAFANNESSEEEKKSQVVSDSDDDDDVSSGWSAKDSIDREIKEMRRLERKKAKKAKAPTLMIEKELKKEELGATERQRLKEIVSKGKARPPSGRVGLNSASAKDAEKIAK